VKPRWTLALALDALSIVVFVVVGRASHHHGESADGIASTLWPFATGAAVGWSLLGLRSGLKRTGGTEATASGSSGSRSTGPWSAGPGSATRPASAGSMGSGVTVCVSTVAVGMALRVVGGQGTAASFVAVAAAFLGACMLGWRAVAAGAGRRLLGAARRSVRR